MKKETFYLKKTLKNTLTKITNKRFPKLISTIDIAQDKGEIENGELLLSPLFLEELKEETKVRTNSIQIFHLSKGVHRPILSILSSEESLARTLGALDYKLKGIEKNIKSLEEKINNNLVITPSGAWVEAKTEEDFKMLAQIKKEKTANKRKRTALCKDIIKLKQDKNIPLFPEEEEFKLKYKV